MNKVIMVFIALFFSACAISQNKQVFVDGKDFVVLDYKNNSYISYQDLIEILSKADIILLGESHGDYKHIVLENKIFKDLNSNLNESSKTLDLALEMMPSSKQGIIANAKFNKNSIKPSQVKREINWDDRWKWDDYSALIKFAFYANSNILGANISREEIAKISNGVEPLRGNLSTKREVRNKIAQIIAQMHNVDLKIKENQKMIENFAIIQQFKDRRMADILVHNQNPVLLLAGNNHINKELGVPLHIKDFQSSKKIVVLSLAIKDENLKSSQADFLISFDK